MCQRAPRCLACRTPPPRIEQRTIKRPKKDEEKKLRVERNRVSGCGRCETKDRIAQDRTGQRQDPQPFPPNACSQAIKNPGKLPLNSKFLFPTLRLGTFRRFFSLNCQIILFSPIYYFRSEALLCRRGLFPANDGRSFSSSTENGTGDLSWIPINAHGRVKGPPEKSVVTELKDVGWRRGEKRKGRQGGHGREIANSPGFPSLPAKYVRSTTEYLVWQ